ncbi:putative cysteine protease atg4 [Xylogone sp. PMI_703]|nr:putative cysteine protease atg4 [Xylogone sp. PMI_703]
MTTVDFGRYKRIVQYFWDPEPTNDTDPDSPIWCLGREYKTAKNVDPTITSTPPKDDDYVYAELPKQAQAATPPESVTSSYDLASGYDEQEAETEDGGWPQAFLDDFESKMWFTYRSNFPCIPKSQDPKANVSMTLSVRLRSQLGDQAGFTSDTGWGCMIRSGQCLLANALVMLRMGRDWRRGSSNIEERNILALFADDPKAPYSIHQFVQHGSAICGKHPGEWFGPSATARCIQALTNIHNDSGLKTYITGDGADVYEDTFMSIAKPNGAIFHPTLILVGTRLGLDKITPVYWDALESSLKMSQSVGIAGGRPSSSHYFIGVQNHSFFYLDPHHTRPALPFPEHTTDYSDEDVSSCHTRRLRRIHVKEMDPSMLIAFLIRDENDWQDWKSAIKQVPGKAVIHIADEDPALYGHSHEREGAIDEVESFDEDEGEEVMVLDE